MTLPSDPQGNLATNPEQSTAPTTTAATTTTTSSSSATTQTNTADHASGRQPTSASAAAAELARTKISLTKTLRRFRDFPIPGINFLDIMPWFLDPAVHATLLRSLELQLLQFGGSDNKIQPDVIVGLDARGFLFGPSLALKLNSSFVAVRKQGKLPGPCVTAGYEKEYGTDYFQMQEDAIKPGQKVLIVDDIIATGGSAAAAGELVKKLGGTLVGYLFIVEIPFLKGRDKLDKVPVVTLLEEA